MHTEKYARLVNLNDTTKLLRAGIYHTGIRPDTSIVYQYIYLSMFCLYSLGDAFPLRFAGHVEMFIACLVTNRLRQRITFFVKHVGHYDTCAFPYE